ncbi:MAG: hotdog fold thioesterase [Candidatus Nanopelagicales bacterium]
MTDFVEQVRAFGSGELGERMGIEILEATADRMVGRMPVEGNRQPFGLLHGGANVVLAETLGSVAAALHAGPDRYPVGIEVSATHHKSATSGYVVGEARAITLGRTLATYEIVIVDEAGARTCTARLTCLLRDRPTS